MTAAAAGGAPGSGTSEKPDAEAAVGGRAPGATASTAPPGGGTSKPAALAEKVVRSSADVYSTVFSVGTQGCAVSKVSCVRQYTRCLAGKASSVAYSMLNAVGRDMLASDGPEEASDASFGATLLPVNRCSSSFCVNASLGESVVEWREQAGT